MKQLTANMRKIVLLNSTITYNHTGCFLTVTGLKALLSRCNATVVYELEVNNYNFGRARSILEQDNQVLLVINGEGTLHDDQPYARALLQFAEPFAQRTLVLNAQIRDMSDTYVKILKSMRLLQVRTLHDKKWCRENGLDNVLYCPDMIFYSGYEPDIENQIKTKRYVLYTDSHSNVETKRIVEYYRKDKRPNKIWVNMHYSYPGKGRFIAKLFLLKFLGKIMPDEFFWRYQGAREKNLSEILEVFNAAECVVTGRYHAACLAIQARAPLLFAGSNTKKIQNLADDFNWGTKLGSQGIGDYPNSLAAMGAQDGCLSRNLTDPLKTLEARLKVEFGEA